MVVFQENLIGGTHTFPKFSPAAPIFQGKNLLPKKGHIFAVSWICSTKVPFPNSWEQPEQCLEWQLFSKTKKYCCPGSKLFAQEIFFLIKYAKILRKNAIFRGFFCHRNCSHLREQSDTLAGKWCFRIVRCKDIMVCKDDFGRFQKYLDCPIRIRVGVNFVCIISEFFENLLFGMIKYSDVSHFLRRRREIFEFWIPTNDQKWSKNEHF